MKKTSRRTFGKLMTGALASVPLASIVAQTPPRAPKTRSLQDILTHENTPPPIEIGDGSFHIQIKHPDLGDLGANPLLAQSGSGRSWAYKGRVNGAKDNTISHLRIIHGSGEILHQDLNAVGSKILIQLNDEAKDPAGNLTFEGLPSMFVVTSEGVDSGNGDGKLTPSKNPGKPKFKYKWSHKGGGNGSRDFRITRIIVTKANGSVLAFDESVDMDNYESQDFRILIWLQP